MTGPENTGKSASCVADYAPPGCTFAILPRESGQRLDHFLAHQFQDRTRSELNKLIGMAHVLVDGRQVKAGHRLRQTETVTVVFPPPTPSELIPEQVDFSILYEDEHLLVIDKPPGLVVHPAGGHRNGTLVHGLLHRCRELPAADAQRPGIVHRLDKDTSGVMLVAKTENALRSLMADFKERRVSKTYLALLLRCPREAQGRVVAPIGRHAVDRKKMAIRPEHGRYAVTNWHIVEHFANGWCLARIDIETGRTHQIRVHMASLKCPVAGDDLYGGKIAHNAPIKPKRQMLHASTLCFHHPATGAAMTFTAPLATDMQWVIDTLRGMAA